MAPESRVASPPSYAAIIQSDDDRGNQSAIPSPGECRANDSEPLPVHQAPLQPYQRLSGLLLPLFLLPLTLLLLFTLLPDEAMSSLGDVFKGVLLPALVALALYLLLHFALLPLYRRHRARYSQYLPVSTSTPLATLTSSTSTLRHRFLSFLLPSRWAEWRYAHRSGERVVNATDMNDEDDDEEMGEDLEFDVEGLDPRRRDGLSLSMDARTRAGESDRRLSRDLEEGFADSSDEEDGGVR